MLTWNTPRSDLALIVEISDRAAREFKYGDRLSLQMDLEACHNNGCPLDLEGLLHASPFDFTHDLSGIMQNLDRRTGKLSRFLPRFARSCRGN